MRVLVCGGRHYADIRAVHRVLDAIHAASPIDLIIHGGANGADTLAAAWARENEVDAYCCAAKWKIQGNRAGPIRNSRMLNLLIGEPDVVVAFPGGSGTQDMVNKATAAGIRVEIATGI